MATRRKYKKPQGYRDGGSVPSEPESTEVLPPATPPEIIDEPPPVVADGGTVVPPPAPDSHEPVRAMLDASRHAEQLQWERQAIEREIASYQISDFKKDFLRQNPMLLNDAIKPISQRVHQAALAAGVPDDTPEMNAAMLDGVQREIDARRQRMAQSAADAIAMTPPMPEPTVEKAAERLATEAEALSYATNAASTTPMTMAEEIASAAPPKRRSIPTSAPVARNVPTLSGKPVEDFRSITLTPEQRIVARNSFGPIKDAATGQLRDLTDHEKERLYAANLVLMRRMRADGTLNE